MNRWILVPMRGLADGKSRLGGVLDRAARRRLNRLLLERALDAVAEVDPGLGRCIVASACDEALELARGRGAEGLREANGTGLNAALEGARIRAVAREATSILTLAADLPCINGAALRRLLAGCRTDAAAVIADQHGHGTNGLLLPADSGLRFAFGEGSLARHLAMLGSNGLVWHDPALAFDLDSPSDYAAWQRDAAPAAVGEPHDLRHAMTPALLG